jgi:putative peptidoglycan lipid II flippase
VQTDRADLAKLADPDSAQRIAVGIARGAALIASLTVLSRLLGLVRTLVFSQSIGAGCLGTAYVTAFQVPNLIAELALGGALTSAMVPVLASSAARAGYDPAEKERLDQISSALLTWAVIILVPVTLLVTGVAGPIASLLNPANADIHCSHAEVVRATTGMIEVFAPQILLYGLSVALIGLLQSFRRFAGPALAPVIVNLALITSYLAFVPLDKGSSLARTPVAAMLVLSAGATLSIGALVLVVLVPAWRLRLRFRPALRLPAGIARKAGGLVVVGIVEFVATDLSTVVVIELANGRGDTGARVLVNWAWLIFNSVFSVLAISVVTSTFPVLAAREGTDFDRTCAGSTRAIVLMSWLGSAAIVAIAVPAAHVLAKQPGQVPELIGGFIMFAPGVASMAVVTNLSRVMLALGRLKIAAGALAGSWLMVIAADVLLAGLAPARLVVAALALGNTLGQTLVAVPLVMITRRIRGEAAVRGVGRATLAGLAAAAAAAIVGLAVSLALPSGGKLLAAGVAVVSAICAIMVFSMVCFPLAKADMRTATARARELARLRP